MRQEFDTSTFGRVAKAANRGAFLEMAQPDSIELAGAIEAG